MNIRLLAFASASEAIGSGELDYTVASDGERVPTVKDLKFALTASHPHLALLWQRLAVSVDGEIVADTEELSEGVEVALLPPVSGG